MNEQRHPFASSAPVAILTGATSGIGQVAARSLVARGFSLVVVNRNRARTQALLEELHALRPRNAQSGSVDAKICDLSSLDEVAQCALQLRSQYPKVHLLIHNAGCCFQERSLTRDGRERTWTVNQLAPFLMTQCLTPSLKAAQDSASPSRIVVVASQAHHRGRLHLSDPHAYNRRYNGYRQYAFSKLANVMWTRSLDLRLKEQGVRAYAYHPGVVDTNIASNMDGGLFGLFFRIARPLLRTPAQGARTLLTLACTPSPVECEHRYYIDDQPARISSRAQSLARAKALWRVCEQECQPIVAALRAKP